MPWTSAVGAARHLLASLPAAVAASILLHLALIVYGAYADADTSTSVRFTDVDYDVFADATLCLVRGASPYGRATYRYTPLLAYILLPNVWVHASFGKFLFAGANVACGVLLVRILTLLSTRGRLSLVTSRDGIVRLVALSWLLNPFVAAIAARGSADSIVATLAVAVLYCLLRRQYALAGLVFGLAVHFKIYPVVYAVPFWFFIDSPSIYTGTHSTTAVKLASVSHNKVSFDPAIDEIQMQQQQQQQQLSPFRYPTRLFTRNRIVFGFFATLSFVGLTGMMYLSYGYEFIYNTYLYHAIRKDHRHNFSVYFFQIYLSLSPLYKNQIVTDVTATYAERFSGLISFLPQFILVIHLGLKFHRQPWFAIFCQTYAFVMLNKVITSQYFVWYIAILPLVLPNSRIVKNGKLALKLVSIWVLSQAIWLYFAFGLEFLGNDTFFEIWIGGIIFYLSNCYILRVFITEQTDTEHSHGKHSILKPDTHLGTKEIASPSKLTKGAKPDSLVSSAPTKRAPLNKSLKLETNLKTSAEWIMSPGDNWSETPVSALEILHDVMSFDASKDENVRSKNLRFESATVFNSKNEIIEEGKEKTSFPQTRLFDKDSELEQKSIHGAKVKYRILNSAKLSALEIRCSRTDIQEFTVFSKFRLKKTIPRILISWCLTSFCSMIYWLKVFIIVGDALQEKTGIKVEYMGATYVLGNLSIIFNVCKFFIYNLPLHYFRMSSQFILEALMGVSHEVTFFDYIGLPENTKMILFVGYLLHVVVLCLYFMPVGRLFTAVRYESLLVIPNIGLQLTTKYVFGAPQVRLVQIEEVGSIVINEAITFFEVRYYMAVQRKVVVESDMFDRLTPLSPNSLVHELPNGEYSSQRRDSHMTTPMYTSPRRPSNVSIGQDSLLKRQVMLNNEVGSLSPNRGDAMVLNKFNEKLIKASEKHDCEEQQKQQMGQRKTRSNQQSPSRMNIASFQQYLEGEEEESDSEMDNEESVSIRKKLVLESITHSRHSSEESVPESRNSANSASLNLAALGLQHYSSTLHRSASSHQLLFRKRTESATVLHQTSNLNHADRISTGSNATSDNSGTDDQQISGPYPRQGRRSSTIENINHLVKFNKSESLNEDVSEDAEVSKVPTQRKPQPVDVGATKKIKVKDMVVIFPNLQPEISVLLKIYKRLNYM